MSTSSIQFPNYIQHEKQKNQKYDRGRYNKSDDKLEKRTNAVHSNIYQLKVLMLFLYRGISRKYSFRLSTEVEEVKKFDELIFEYTQNGRKMFRLLQAKHKLDESKMITIDNLLNESNGDYNLIKYFFFYHECKKEQLFQSGVIKDITICTNIDFDYDNLKEAGIQIEKVNENDDILDVISSVKQSKRYKFKKTILPKIKQKLQNYRSSRIQLSDKEIQDYFNHLIFSVNQPNEKELGKIVKTEIGREFNFIKTENIYNKFFIEMLDWMQDKPSFISFTDGIKFFEEARRGIPIWFDVRNSIDTFTGRNEELIFINKLLLSDNKVVVCGLGGVGKSELARKFLNEYNHEYDNKIVWINADTYQSLTDSFRRLACNKLNISMKNIDGEEKDIKTIIKNTYEFFSNGKSLFVFDNAEKYKSQNDDDNGLDKFLPSLSSDYNKPYILITSCYHKWPKIFKVLNLNAFNSKEARSFIEKSLNLGNNSQSKSMKELGEKLQHFPLALQQAVSYINTQDQKLQNIGKKFTISNYLERYNERTKELLNHDFPDDHHNIYCKTMYTTWDITLDAINKKDKDALEILYIASYLASDDIPIDIYFQLINDDEKLGSAIDLLKQYSIINVNIENRVFSIHRLVQDVTKIKIIEVNLEITIIEKALSCFNKSIIINNTEHAISVWSHANKHVALVRKYSNVAIHIANTLFENYREEEAFSFATQEYKVLNSVQNTNSELKKNITLLKNITALILMRRNEYTKAFTTLQEIYYAQRALDDIGDITILNTKYNLAQVLHKQGKYKEALIWYVQVHEASCELVAINHPLTLRIKEGLAILLIDLAKYDEAYEILEDLYNFQNKVLGKEDRSTLFTKSNIASVFGNLNKHKEALQLFKEVYEVQKKILGRDDHPEILRTKNNMASMMKEVGNCDEALKIFEEVMEAQVSFRGKDHPNVLFIRCSIGDIYSQQGKYDKAINILQDVFEKQKFSLGPNHPHSLRTQHYLGATLHTCNKYAEALKIFKDAFKREIALSGNDHPNTLDIRNRIAALYLELEEHEQALKHYHNLLEIRERVLGTYHEKSLDTRAMITMIFLKLKNYDKAIEQYYELIEKEEECLGKEHPKTIMTKNNVAMVLANNKREYDIALTLLNDVLQVQEKKLGPNHSITVKIKENIDLITKMKADHETLRRINLVRTPSISNKDLLSAIQNNDCSKFENLIKQGGNIHLKDSGNRTLLHYAVNNDSKDMVNVLLKHEVDPFQVDNEGISPLHSTVCKGNNEILEILLQNINRKKLGELLDRNNGTTLLHVAAESGSLEVVKCLLKYGAPFNIKDKDNNLPVNISKNKEIVDFLTYIENLFKEVKRGNTEAVSKLQLLNVDEFSAVTNTRNYKSNTLLQVAIINKHKNIASQILQLLRKSN